MLLIVDERKQLRIFVSGGAKKTVEDFAVRFDMKEQGVASRIYEWFGKQPPAVQKWICGLVEGNEGEGMRLFAAELARRSAKPDGPAFDEDAVDENGEPLQPASGSGRGPAGRRKPRR
jgi:hypothetical protein